MSLKLRPLGIRVFILKKHLASRSPIDVPSSRWVFNLVYTTACETDSVPMMDLSKIRGHYGNINNNKSINTT